MWDWLTKETCGQVLRTLEQHLPALRGDGFNATHCLLWIYFCSICLLPFIFQRACEFHKPPTNPRVLLATLAIPTPEKIFLPLLVTLKSPYHLLNFPFLKSPTRQECFFSTCTSTLAFPRAPWSHFCLVSSQVALKKGGRARLGCPQCSFAATPHRYSVCSPPCWWASSTEFSCIKNCTCQRGKTNDDSNNVEEHPLNIWEGWIMNHFYQDVQEALKY